MQLVKFESVSYTCTSRHDLVSVLDMLIKLKSQEDITFSLNTSNWIKIGSMRRKTIEYLPIIDNILHCNIIWGYVNDLAMNAYL